MLEVDEKIENPFQWEIRMLPDRTDIAKTCPNTKKKVADLSQKGKRVPGEYHLGAIRILHCRFEGETRAVFPLEWFRQKFTSMLFIPNQTTGTLIYVLHALTLK